VTTNRQDVDVWKPVETGGDVIRELNRVSAIESVARPEPMASDTKRVRRSGDFDVAGVAKGAEYGFDTNTNDYVELIAAKVGGLRKFAEEDLGGDVEGGTDLLGETEKQAANALAVTFDQGTIGTTAARNGTTVLWPSIYYTLATAAAGLPLGAYTAGANIVQWDQTDVVADGKVGYRWISQVLGIYEEGPYYDEGNTVILASPSWRRVLREVMDGNGRPYWQDGQDNLFGYPVKWTVGARKHATTTSKPTGNPLLVVANSQLLIKGMARLTPQMVNANPGVAIQRAVDGIGFLSDEAIFKAAMRRAFVLGEPRGAAILEYNAGPLA
jgi:hypothetical protein